MPGARVPRNSPADRAHDLRQRARYILRQMPAIGTWIADQLMSLIKRLREFECALRAERVQPIRMPLQFRQVVEQRRRHALGLRFDLFDVRLTGTDTFADGLCFFAVGGSFAAASIGSTPGRNHVPVYLLAGAWREGRHDISIIFGNEVPNGKLAIDDHRERRRLHATDRELFIARRACTLGTGSCRRANRRGCVPGRHRQADRTRASPSAARSHRESLPV